MVLMAPSNQELRENNEILALQQMTLEQNQNPASLL